MGKPEFCSKCGDCCTLSFEVAEFDVVADSGLVERPTGSHLSMKRDENERCLAWARGIGCLIYEHRPEICRMYTCEKMKARAASLLEEATNG
jgi:Fe-S-cluster containining protein